MAIIIWELSILVALCMIKKADGDGGDGVYDDDGVDDDVVVDGVR